MSYVDLYHRTTAEAAARVYAAGGMLSRENTAETYWSNRVDGQAAGYGQAVVHIRVPAHLAELEDEFPDGEQHFRIPAQALRPEYFVAADVGPVIRPVGHGTTQSPPPDLGPTMSL